MTKSKRSLSEKARVGPGGFIVAELIVVIAVIVFLAVLLIPNVVKFIDNAKADNEVNETRIAVTALQCMMTLNYEKSDQNTVDAAFFDRTDVYNIKLTKQGHSEIEALADMELGRIDKIVFVEGGQLRAIRYHTLSGATVYYDETEYTVEFPER